MIFVTGGTGLVGSHLLFELTKGGEKVRALKRPTSNLSQVVKTFSYYTNDAQKLFDSIEWVDGDILDYFALEELLRGVDVIYHCAAIVSFDGRDRSRMIGNNVEGTSNLINAALENQVKRICHVSSIAALGKRENGEMVNEETNWIPAKKHSAYSESKFFSEAEIWRGVEEGIDAVIVNPSIILGPGNWENSSAKFFKTVWDGMKYYTRGVTGYVDVRDVVSVMLQLMNEAHFERCKNQRYLLNAENLTYEEVFNQIADAIGKPRPSVFASDFMTAIAWRLAKVGSWFTRKQPVLTKEVATGRNDINNYDGSKIITAINFQYTPVSASIKNTAKLFLADVK
ncbi:NAD-dependent epimerase/dehydratase family protein [Maribellus sediminis]|uniref:NAD-dependent epimerase/dehydratase family protein n=1 Tax=Maribellus sediminis TaxID=2696285 RepID=UPI00142F8D67|nr:NAD-dependent epimerase/dehydratase family protein [Maribellus sediminis]